jgi:uncharacterized membrane protein YeaQ/YmgE (transglycosylase-associated protein family)
VHAQDYLAAAVFGLVIGVVARILLPGRQRIGLLATVAVGMAAALAGTWVSDHWDLHSSHLFRVAGRQYDWLMVAVQVGIAVVGVALAALLARGFSTDRPERSR